MTDRLMGTRIRLDEVNSDDGSDSMPWRRSDSWEQTEKSGGGAKVRHRLGAELTGLSVSKPVNTYSL